MTVNERPGVYSSIEVSSARNGARLGRTVGLAAVATSGAMGQSVKISSLGEAEACFGSGCSMVKLIKILLLNGAAAIEAVPVVTKDVVATKADYETAFAVLMSKEKVSVMLCDSGLAEVHKAMQTAIMGASESFKYRIGVIEGLGNVGEMAAKAAALNCERMVMVYPGESGTGAVPGAVAAAFGGVLGAGGDPALPVCGAELLGLEGFDRRFSDAEITTLVQAGITPIEHAMEKNCVVRGITTRTTTTNEADSTWRELSTVLIIDDVIPAVRAALRIKFPRVKNTVQTRGAIRTQVIIELENKLKQEIIDSYGAVTAAADALDPSVCAVGFDFTVAHGLNRINLSAHISI
ncbi:MAG: phage tail sheath protein [Oscillospiraceae bacterium]